MQKKKKIKTSSKSQQKQLRKAITLSGIAIQMGVTIYLSVSLGQWLDTKFNNGKARFVVVATLLGMAIAIYSVIKQSHRTEI